MKLKVNWKELARQLWAAVRPVLLGAIGGGKVMIEGKGLASATECTISCKDVAGNEHSSTYHHIDPEFTATDTLVTIDVDMIASEMRNLCSEADSSLDIPTGGTVKLTLSDGTELTHHVSFGG